MIYLITALFFSIVVAVFAVLAVFGLQIMALRHTVQPGRIVVMTFLAGAMIATSVILVLMIQGSVPVRFVKQAKKESPCLAYLSALPRPSQPCALGKGIL